MAVHRLSLKRKLNVFSKIRDSKAKHFFSYERKLNSTEDHFAPIAFQHEDDIDFRTKATREDFMHNGSFYEAIGPVLALAQCFGLMPVSGVQGRNAHCLSFKWTSIRAIWSVVFIFTTIADTLMTGYAIFDQTVEFKSLEGIIFHLALLVAMTSLLKLAQLWPDLMVKWEIVEAGLPQYDNQKDKGRLAMKIKMIAFVGLMISLCEHLLSTISAIHFANYCPARPDPIESYFVSVVSHLFYVFEYNPLLAWIGKIENVLLTFVWSYTDIFLMIIGLGLSSQFKKVNDKLDANKGQDMPESFWTETRLQYRSVCILVEEVDKAISLITLLSFANNLYFICIQLLKSLNEMPSIAHAIYFYFSLAFLLGRTLAVSLYTSEIYDKSKYPLQSMRFLSKDFWWPETDRLFYEIRTDTVALSGLGFFHVTRKLILTVAGTIVTYELVLIQFHEDERHWDCGI